VPRRRSFLLVPALLVFVALAGEPSARAAFPGGNGLIVYQYEAPVPGEQLSQNDLFVVEPDGTGRQRLTDTPHKHEFGPAWNPAGARIVFWRARAPFGPGSVWRMDADGSHVRRLTPAGLDARDPAWSPGGDRVVYDAEQDLFTIRASDGGGRVRVTDTPNVGEFEPAWSPAGGRIVYTRSTAQGDVGDLFVTDLATGHVTHLTASPDYDHQAAWSPDGSQVVFERDFDDHFSIFVVNADGSDLHRVSAGPHFDTGPAFSPDGTKIVFGSDRGGSFFDDLWLMKADGSNKRRIRHDEFSSAFPDWQPLAG
jgi:Tol biopolymer transport system component